jgi:hypothetical protein
MPFEIVGDITQVETIATGRRIRELTRLRRLYGRGRWRKLKGLPWSACGVGPYAARSCIGMRRMASVGRRSSASVMSTKSRKPCLRQPVRFVVCIENSGYPASLELHKIYRSVPDPSATREGDLRIVDESGEDYLYPAEWFVAVQVPRRVRTSLLRRPARLQSA